MKCQFNPESDAYKAVGQFHCPACGLMILGGIEHPEICYCKGDAEYQYICDTCNPGWQKTLEFCGKEK